MRRPQQSVRLVVDDGSLDFEEAPDTTIDFVPSLRMPMVQIGPYALGPAIAEGGMGTIHLGRRRGPGRFSRVFAIKRLRSHLADDDAVVNMLLEEARFAGAIRHGNVVPVLDVVIERGEVLLVMEYVHGASVSQLWKTLRAPMPVGIAIAIAIGALRGLHAAHEARDERDVPLGLVHRDMSPHNILVGVDGITRVTDFGIAKAAIASAPATQVGRVKGKLRYLAPEQRLGEPISRQTDIYGVSVVLWEMLTGRRLWDGETDQEIMIRALRERARPPSTFNPKVSTTLDALVRRGLEMDPTLRWESARAFATALEQLGPVASSTEVADWVARVARADLARIAASMVDDEATPPAGRRASDFSGRGSPITSSDIRPKAGSIPPVHVPKAPRLPQIPMARKTPLPPPPVSMPVPLVRPSTPPTALAMPIPSLVPPALTFDPDVARATEEFRRNRIIALAVAAAVIVSVIASLIAFAAIS